MTKTQQTEASAVYAIDKQTTAVRALLESIKAEIEDDPTLAVDMIEGETDFFEAVDSIVDVYMRDGELITGITKRAADLAARKKRVQARQKRLKAVLHQALLIAEVDKVERPDATISTRRGSPSVSVTNDSLVPTEFLVRADPTISLTEIKQTSEYQALIAAHKAITSVKRGKQVAPELYTARDEAEQAFYKAVPGVEFELGADSVNIRAV